jgi:RNA polymerase primary sigma factor
MIMIAQLTSHRNSLSELSTDESSPIARARSILGRSLTYIDHPSFHDPTARDAILAPLIHTVDDKIPRRYQFPERDAPLQAGRFGAPFLSREQEAHLFRQMNYLKSLARRLRDRIDPARARPAELDEVERLLTEALTVRNRIVEANLRLVVSVAKRYTQPGEDLSERVSDGNVALIRATDWFDYARGNRFSTYACWAIINGMRCRKRAKNDRVRFATGHEEMLQSTADTRGDEHDQEKAHKQRQWKVERLLGRLDDRERRIIAGRYGIGGADEKTLKQIGKELGISKERVRQIELRAEDKLRKPARTEALDLLPA